MTENSKKIEPDTVRLLRECDAGARMGFDSISDVIGRAENRQLYGTLDACRGEHEQLSREIRAALDSFGDEGKEPPMMAKSMSWMKTQAEMAFSKNDPDSAIADLMTDGCNMGVKSLSRYLNQYKAADERSKDIAKRLVGCEEKLARDVRGFL